jgi:hypothetical protein
MLSNSGQTDMGHHFVKMFTAMPCFNLAIHASSKSASFRPDRGRHFTVTPHEFSAGYKRPFCLYLTRVSGRIGRNCHFASLTHVLMAGYRRPFCPALHLTLHVFPAGFVEVAILCPLPTWLWPDIGGHFVLHSVSHSKCFRPDL